MRSFKFAFLVTVFLVFVGVAAAVPNNASDILAKAKQASGGAAWDALTSVHTLAKVSTGGLIGKAESWEDVLTGRVLATFEIGPMTGAEGFDGKTLWAQDSSKQARAEEGEDARLGAVDDVYRRSMAYWYPSRGEALIEDTGEKQEQGRRFQTLRITPKGGRVFDIWVDASTQLFDRIVEKTATETRTTFFSDYRRVSGVLIPFATRSTNGQTRYDQLGTVEKVELNVPLDDEMFRMPPPPAPDFELAGGRVSTSVPFELINNHIYVRVRLDGKGPFRLLCDTGGSNVVTPELARELGLKAEGAMEGQGVGEKSEDVGLTKLQTLGLGDVTLHDQVFAVFALASLSDVEGIPIQGLIGYEVFKRFVVTVDYEHNLLTLTLPSAFSYHGRGTAVPFKFNGTIPQVEGEIDGLPGKFDIDTGSRSSLTILAPFAQSHGLKERYGAKLEAVTGWGVGGAARGLMTRAKVLKLGGVPVEAPLIELSLQSKGSFIDPYVAGNVGAGVLKRFNVIFDYGTQRLIFEPNANYGRADNYDRAGMWLNLARDAFQVVDVTIGGPAAEAGLKAGDSILSVDGKTPAELPLPALRAKLRSEPAGTKVKLFVLSNGQKREIEIVLRDLV